MQGRQTGGGEVGLITRVPQDRLSPMVQSTPAAAGAEDVSPNILRSGVADPLRSFFHHQVKVFKLAESGNVSLKEPFGLHSRGY